MHSFVYYFVLDSDPDYIDATGDSDNESRVGDGPGSDAGEGSDGGAGSDPGDIGRDVIDQQLSSDDEEPGMFTVLIMSNVISCYNVI